MKIILSDWQSGGASGKEPAADLRDTVLEDALVKEMATRGRSQDGGGIGRRDHFLFYKFIERTTER